MAVSLCPARRFLETEFVDRLGANLISQPPFELPIIFAEGIDENGKFCNGFVQSSPMSRLVFNTTIFFILLFGFIENESVIADETKTLSCSIKSKKEHKACAPAATPHAKAPVLELVIVGGYKPGPVRISPGTSDVVLTRTALDNGEVKTVDSLPNLVPSLQIAQEFGSGQPDFVLRGVGVPDYASNNAPATVVYVDETAFPIPSMSQNAMFDIERVDVLRGPQGSSFGRNTTGGDIVFKTNKPTYYFSSGADIDVNNEGEGLLSGFVSGPVSHRVRMRLAAMTDQGGGWQHDRVTGTSFGSKDLYSLRLLTDIDLTDDLSLEINMHGGQDHSEQGGLYLFAPLVTAAGTIPADQDRSATGWGTSAEFAREVGISPGAKPFRDNGQWGTDVHAEWRTAPVNIQNDFSYEAMNRKEYDNFDAAALGYADVYISSRAANYADELRFLSPDSDNGFHWSGGTYYSREHLNEDFRTGFIDSAGVDIYDPYTQNVQTEALFGRVVQDLSSKVTVDVGLRYEYETRELDDFNSYGILSSGTSIPFATDINRRTSFSKPSGKFELDYRPISGTLLYASATRGIKSGGFTAHPSTDPGAEATQPFKPETVWAYETGIKQFFDGGRGEVGVSSYFYNYTNQQVKSYTVDPVYNLIAKIVNAPSSGMYGVEARLAWSSESGFHVSQEVAYTRGRYDSFSDVGGSYKNAEGLWEPIIVNRSGQSIGAPKLTFSGSISQDYYSHRLRFSPGLDYSYRADAQNNLSDFYNIQSYFLLGAHFTIAPERGSWTATLYGTNILNKQYDLFRQAFIAGADVAQEGPPATYGIRATMQF